MPHGTHADHYEEHGSGVDSRPENINPKDGLPHGSHADHFEEHGEEK